MSKFYDLHLDVVDVKEPGDRESLIDALRSIGKMDADFSGENGPDYLWDFVDANKYNSNQDYVIDLVKDDPEERSCVERFIVLWMQMSGGYYTSYKYQILEENGTVKTIAFACTY